MLTFHIFVVSLRERRPRLELVKDSCLGRRFLSQLEDPGRVCPKDVFRCLVTVRYIHKLTISSACPGCGAVVTRGTCTYAGCRWNQPGFKVDLKAWYLTIFLFFSLPTFPEE